MRRGVQQHKGAHLAGAYSNTMGAHLAVPEQEGDFFLVGVVHGEVPVHVGPAREHAAAPRPLALESLHLCELTGAHLHRGGRRG